MDNKLDARNSNSPYEYVSVVYSDGSWEIMVSGICVTQASEKEV